MAHAAQIAVIGAGISGLTAAYRLKQAGFSPIVFERSDYAGGRIRSLKRGNFTFDIGAFIYLGSYEDSIESMKEVGLESRLGRFDAYGAMPRNGELKFLDFNHPIRTILGTDYLSAGAKLKAIKLFRLLLKHWKDLNYYDASGIAEIDTDTVSSYFNRELNQELLDYVGSVVVRGPWLTNPDTASIGQLLWTMKNFFKPYFYGLEGGMDALPRALADQLNVRLEHSVVDVTDRGTHVEITYRNAGGEHSDRFDACLITTTTDQALTMYPQMQGAQRALYESTEYIASVNTHLALATRPSNPATYIMVSPREHIDLCGIIVDHKKAAGRTPADAGMLTVFCRHEWGIRNLDTSDDAVLSQVLQFIKPYYGDLADSVIDLEIGRWPRVVPMMPKGRFKAIAAYEKCIDQSACVQFAGDLHPIGGVNSALVSGKRAAEMLRKRFS